MEITKCTKCMMDLEENVRICPHCGYDQQREEQPGNALLCAAGDERTDKGYARG